MEQQSIQVKHVFTDDELLAITRDMAQEQNRLENLESTKKKVAADYKVRIDTSKALLSEMAQKIREGAEFKSVECCVVRDFTEKEVLFIEQGQFGYSELVDIQPMLPQDAQMSIDESEPAVLNSDQVIDAFIRLEDDEQKVVKINRGLLDLISKPAKQLKSMPAALSFKQWMDKHDIEIEFADDDFAGLILAFPVEED